MGFLKYITRMSYFFPATFLTTKIDIQCQVGMDKVNITGKQCRVPTDQGIQGKF